MKLIRTFVAMFLSLSLISAQTKIEAGTYKGQWAGSSGGGDFTLTIQQDGKNATVGFTLGGEQVPCKVLNVKMDGAKIVLTYEFDLQGNKLESAIEGNLKGKAFEGTYKTSAGDQAVDQGTWKAELS